MMNVKKNDAVIVLAGKDKGKKGSILEILPTKGKVKVKDVAVLTMHKKQRRQGELAGIVKQEGWIDISKVMLICSSCKKPSRVGFTQSPENKKVRMCRRCKEII